MAAPPCTHQQSLPALCHCQVQRQQQRLEHGLGEITLKTVGSFPPGVLCGTLQGPLGRAGKKTVAGVVRLTGTVAGWHDKGGDGGPWEKERDSGWF